MNTGAYDPFQTLNFAGQGPVWGVSDLLSLTFDDDSDTAQDVSGNNRDHAWADGDGSRTVDTTMTPDGGQTLANGGGGSGYTDADWTGFDWISSGLPLHPLGIQVVHQPTSLASLYAIWAAGDGTYYARLNVKTDGSLEFQLSTSVLSYKWTTDTSIVSAGTKYTIQFWLSADGETGQFYVGSSASAFTGSITTTRSAL
jgi:hypothetical protein